MNNEYNISKQELDKGIQIINNLINYYKQKIVGQENLVNSILIALMANGHILLESVPGLAKTTAAKIITSAVAGRFSRIQCTPDLLPSDIIGGQIFNYSTSSFETKLGPIFANFVLLDEINRSSAKTQSAMLEAMQERQTTIGGVIYKLPKLFVVIATQNPVEQEGTYNLAEAQTDRFLIKEVIDYPSPQEEVEILSRLEKNVFDENKQILTITDLIYLQYLTEKVYIDKNMKRYITEIVNVTRHPEKYLEEKYYKYITMGASTRASIAFMEAGKANALLNGRSFVTPDDIKEIAYRVLRHRIALSFAADANGIKVEEIIDEIMKVVPTPWEKHI